MLTEPVSTDARAAAFRSSSAAEDELPAGSLDGSADGAAGVADAGADGASDAGRDAVADPPHAASTTMSSVTMGAVTVRKQCSVDGISGRV